MFTLKYDYMHITYEYGTADDALTPYLIEGEGTP